MYNLEKYNIFYYFTKYMISHNRLYIYLYNKYFGMT